LDDFAEALSTSGLLAIHSNDFDTSALEIVCQKSWEVSVLLPDGVTTRTTLATATVGTTPLPLLLDADHHDNDSSLSSLEGLRDVVSTASNAFVQALDRLLLSDKAILQTSRGVTYSSVSSIVKASVHLEHFHLYSNAESREGEEDNARTDSSVLDWHTDAGLFLAFVPGINCNGDSSDTSLWVDGSPVTFPPNTIGIMLGSGAEHWLHTTVPLRATRHAVKMRPGDLRAWYGMSKSSFNAVLC
jgi:hypothetical protein